MTPEGKVKIWLKNQFDRKYSRPWSYSPPGGMFGQAGQADKFFLIDGVFVVIEVKREGGSPTPLQIKRLRVAQASGAIAASMIGKDYQKLNMIFAEIDRRSALMKEHVLK
jgi:hypothetical protein